MNFHIYMKSGDIFRIINPSQKLINDVDAELEEEIIIKEYLKKKFVMVDAKVFQKKDIEMSVTSSSNASKILGLEQKVHVATEHKDILLLFNTSISFAPKDSHVLIESYIGRILALYHLEKYEDCRKDCERGFKMKGTSEYHKIYFICYMCMCLRMLSRPVTAKIHDYMVSQIHDVCEKKNWENHDLIKWTKKYLTHAKVVQIEPEEPKATQREYQNFERHEKIPFASKSIEMIRNEEGEVRIVASRDIEPGEVIVVEKRFGPYVEILDGLILHCSYCKKQCWALIPCNHCSADMYCSEDCRLKDWTYHKWMCKVLPLCFFLFKPFMKFFINLVNEAGGLDNFADYFNEDEQINESLDQDFDYTKIKTYYNTVKNNLIEAKTTIPQTTIDNVCQVVSCLAGKSSFLGKSFTKTKNILKEKSGIYLAALMLRGLFIMKLFHFSLVKYNRHDRRDRTRDIALFPFVRYFRHSCCPNASFFTSKDQETVIFAKYRIKKGSKITISYIPNVTYLDQDHYERNEFTRIYYEFQCSCIACEENWHPHRAKPLKILLKNKPKLLEEMTEKCMPTLKRLRELHIQGNGIPYSYIKKIIDILKILHEASLVHSMEYELLFKYLHFSYIARHGFIIESVPTKCNNNNNNNKHTFDLTEM